MVAHFEMDAGEIPSASSDDPNGFTRVPEASYEKAATGATNSQIEELKAAKDSIDKDKLRIDLAIRSFDRAADAIKNGIRVFISYKFIQRPLAEKFRDLIRAYGQEAYHVVPANQLVDSSASAGGAAAGDGVRSGPIKAGLEAARTPSRRK
ncbi:MAG TPA: hypothetical protein VGF39_11800, partial [Stellaceae bacterium]